MSSVDGAGNSGAPYTGSTGTDQTKQTEGSHAGKAVKPFEGDAPSVRNRKQDSFPEYKSLTRQRSTRNTRVPPRLKPKPSSKQKHQHQLAQEKNPSTPFSGPHVSARPLQQSHNVVFQPTTTPPPVNGTYTLTSVSLEQKNEAPLPPTGEPIYAQVRKPSLPEQQARIKTEIKAQIKLRPPIKSKPKADTPDSKGKKVKDSDSQPVKPVPRPQLHSTSTTTSPLYSTPISPPVSQSESPNYAAPPPPRPAYAALNPRGRIEENIYTRLHFPGNPVKKTDSEPLYASLNEAFEKSNGNKVSGNPLYEAIDVPPPLPPRPEQLLSKKTHTYHHAGDKLETLLREGLKGLEAEVQSLANTKALKKSQRKASKSLALLETRREKLNSLRNQLKTVTSKTSTAELKKLRQQVKNFNAQLLPIVKYAHGGSKAASWLLDVPAKPPRK